MGFPKHVHDKIKAILQQTREFSKLATKLKSLGELHPPVRKFASGNLLLKSQMSNVQPDLTYESLVQRETCCLQVEWIDPPAGQDAKSQPTQVQVQTPLFICQVISVLSPKKLEFELTFTRFAHQLLAWRESASRQQIDTQGNPTPATLGNAASSVLCNIDGNPYELGKVVGSLARLYRRIGRGQPLDEEKLSDLSGRLKSASLRLSVSVSGSSSPKTKREGDDDDDDEEEEEEEEEETEKVGLRKRLRFITTHYLLTVYLL